MPASEPADADTTARCQHLLAAGVPRLQRLAARMLGQDAEDGLQEVMAAACRSLPGFRGESQLSTWLHRLGLRVLCAFRQRRDRRNGREQPDAEAENRLSPAALRAYAATPLDRLGADERRARVHQALDRLSPAHREILLLRGEGLTYLEIATTLAIPLGTTKSRLAAAMVALAERLPDREELLP